MSIGDILSEGAGGIGGLKAGRDALVVMALDLALSVPGDRVLECKGTSFGVPSVHAWKFPGPIRASDVATLFSEGSDSGIDDVLNLGIDASMAFEIIAAINGDAIVPDSWMDSYGTELLDGTVPGIALFLGEPKEASVFEITECVGRGLIAILSGGYSKIEIVGENILKIGAEEALGINGLVSRAALKYGGAVAGNRTSMGKYLKKKPKLAVIHTGKLTVSDITAMFSAAAAGAFIVSDSPDLPNIPRICETSSKEMVAKAIANRGITFGNNKGVRFVSASENQRIRKADARLEFGGPDAPPSCEVAIACGHAEDGRTTTTGKDIQELEGGAHSLSIEVLVSGGVDFSMEQAIERRIHFALSRTEGVWHSGQRDNSWIRISSSAVENGLTFADLGSNIISDIKENFPTVAEAVEVVFTSDPSSASSKICGARERYGIRDRRLSEISDRDVDCFFTCTICQTYAPGHICIISPERPSVCGSVTWTDAKVGSEVNPGGPQRPFPKGHIIDAEKGEWTGANDIVRRASMGSIQRIYMHSVAKYPMTACSCMEVAAIVSSDRRSVILLDRSDTGRNPSGYSFSEVSDMVGRGEQHPGFMGIGKHYILSPGFLRGDGGIARISWMSSRLKSVLGESLRKAFFDAGISEAYFKIADENVAEDAGSLGVWLEENEHPAMLMDPIRL
jgi:acetyl-CoA synthase